jgi:hypothetical protein
MVLETSKKFSLRFVKHIKFHIIEFINMECKENDVSDADIDDGFPADIEEAASRAALDLLLSKFRQQYDMAYNRFLE